MGQFIHLTSKIQVYAIFSLVMHWQSSLLVLLYLCDI